MSEQDTNTHVNSHVNLNTELEEIMQLQNKVNELKEEQKEILERKRKYINHNNKVMNDLMYVKLPGNIVAEDETIKYYDEELLNHFNEVRRVLNLISEKVKKMREV